MKTIFSIILLSLFHCYMMAQKSVDLKYDLELNKTYRVKSTSVQNMKQTMQGMEQNQQTTNKMVMSLKPLKYAGNDIIAEVRFDTIITITSTPPMEINSTREGNLKSNDPAQMMECIMNRLSNSTFLVQMSNTGRVIEILNIEQMAANILQGIDSIQGQMAEFVKMQSGMMVGKDAIKTMIEGVTAYLPGEKTKVGEKWDSNLNMTTGGMEIIVNTNFKLTDIDKNTGKLSGDVVIESGSKPMKMGEAEITPDVRGLGKSDFDIDVNTGWIVQGTSKQQIKGEMSVNAPGVSMQIPIEINSESVITALP